MGSKEMKLYLIAQFSLLSVVLSKRNKTRVATTATPRSFDQPDGNDVLVGTFGKIRSEGGKYCLTSYIPTWAKAAKGIKNKGQWLQMLDCNRDLQENEHNQWYQHDNQYYQWHQSGKKGAWVRWCFAFKDAEKKGKKKIREAKVDQCYDKN